MNLNAEIKARCADLAAVRTYLDSKNAEFRGTDEQTDTYFNSPNGRLKLREGNIENNLIYYVRTNKAGTKDSFFRLVKTEDAAALKEVLTHSMGVKVVVKKTREIRFIANVKFHIDDVPGLGSFVEIEASNLYADLSADQLREQCEFYIQELGIRPEDLISVSYSDMLMEKAVTG